jgi:hypothetical protein
MAVRTARFTGFDSRSIDRNETQESRHSSIARPPDRELLGNRVMLGAAISFSHKRKFPDRKHVSGSEAVIVMSSSG